MDTQIWYAIFSTLFGGIYGAFRRLGEVNIIPGMVHLSSIPGGDTLFLFQQLYLPFPLANLFLSFILHPDPYFGHVEIPVSIITWCFQCTSCSKGAT